MYKKIHTYFSYFSTQSQLELRHLSHWGIIFCMPVWKKSAACELSHVLTPPKFLIIVEVLWSQPVLQVGKQVVVAQSEIRAVGRVIKQLPVEMLQQCLSANSCIGHAVSWRSTTLDVSIPLLLLWMALCGFFSVLQYTSDIIVVPYWAWIPPSALLSCPRK
jgi:hypothetical protein